MGEKITAKAKKYCPISAAAEVLADHWSVVILRDIAIFDQRTFNGGGINYTFIINGLSEYIFGVRISVFLMSL